MMSSRIMAVAQEAGDVITWVWGPQCSKSSEVSKSEQEKLLIFIDFSSIAY